MAKIEQDTMLAANRVKTLYKKAFDTAVPIETLCSPSREAKGILENAMLHGGDLGDAAETLWDKLFPGQVVGSSEKVSKKEKPKGVASEKKEPPKKGFFAWLTSEKESKDDDDDDDERIYRGGVR